MGEERERSASGQCLQNKNFAGVVYRIAKFGAIAVHEHHNVMPEAPLIVQNVAAKPRIVPENLVEDIRHRLSGHQDGGSVDVALEIGSKNDAWHGSSVAHIVDPRQLSA